MRQRQYKNKSDNLQEHAADIPVSISFGADAVPVLRRRYFRQISIIKDQAAIISHGGQHEKENAPTKIGPVKKKKKTAACGAHITEEAHEALLIPPGVGDGG